MGSLWTVTCARFWSHFGKTGSGPQQHFRTVFSDMGSNSEQVLNTKQEEDLNKWIYPFLQHSIGLYIYTKKQY